MNFIFVVVHVMFCMLAHKLGPVYQVCHAISTWSPARKMPLNSAISSILIQVLNFGRAFRRKGAGGLNGLKTFLNMQIRRM